MTTSTLTTQAPHASRAAPQREQTPLWRDILAPMASLRLTVLLLGLSILVIFAGTWAQIDQGIWQVQKSYFHTFLTWIPFKIFLPRPGPGESPIPGSIPMLGGFSLILLLLMNLIAAHVLRFKMSWKRSGILLIHAGLILLLLGELVTGTMQVESRMIMSEGGSANFSEDIREVELAIVDRSPADHNNVAVIPGWRLARGGKINHDKLPFEIAVDEFFPNSGVFGPQQAPAGMKPRATAGKGTNVIVAGKAQAAGVDGGVDMPSAYVTLAKAGASLGTYLVTTGLENFTQNVDVDGKTYQIDLRFRRFYKPYTMHLLDFTHERYTGTDVPKDFASTVRLVDPSHGEDRQVRIWMNNPLRYGGETFYQASFLPGDTTSILQVVRNPGWLVPYIACAMVTLGLFVHFGIMLLRFLNKQLSPAPQGATVNAGQPAARPRRSFGELAIPGLIVALCAMYLASVARAPKSDTPFEVQAFGRLPVSYNGRIMPIDSLARYSLLAISGKSEFKHEDRKITAVEWMLDMMAKPEQAAKYKVFRIDHPEIVGMLGFEHDRKYFSVDEILTKGQALSEQVNRAGQIDAKKRNLFQKKIMELWEHFSLYRSIAQVGPLHLAPPTAPGGEWQTVSLAMKESNQSREQNPGVATILSVIDGWSKNQPQLFNESVQQYWKILDTSMPAVQDRAGFEVVFNRLQPFLRATALYVIVFLLAIFSWVFAGKTLRRAAFWVLVLTLLFHTAALLGRMYISGRPPVTNLYSSAIFIAWGCGIFAAMVELIFRNGLGSAVAAVLGFLSLIVAHNLGSDGDTMTVLQAVLDTNFWLATHVVVITLGYAATFLAGGFAIVGIAMHLFGSGKDDVKLVARIVYGIICFGMLFSFVGTILGGIWADQSWGRFWGWDPKENGAAMIVLWNAIILHARWGGMIRERGLMVLAVFGNVVTSWSWFGTNMLGVGLHSYGFMDSAVFWMGAFIASQLLVMALAAIPARSAPPTA